jgi:hypothetical protein
MFEPRGGKYICHAMPASAYPAPINAVMGKREEGGYELPRMEARKSNKRELQIWCIQGKSIPCRDRDVQLDVAFLKKMGLTKKRMLECIELFFNLLILPIVDPTMSGIDGDTRMGYYKDVARNTNMYAFGVKNRGGTRRHVFCSTSAEELLVWDGIVHCNINANIAESWMMN